MNKAERNLCVLFADISGSTRLYEKLGDKEALYAVERCINRMTRATEQFRGRVIKTIGDEVMAVFDDAEDCMSATCNMQQRVEDLPPVSGIKLSIRAGFHFGPAIEDAQDVFGDTVNTAARMAGLAKAGQIITTAETVATLPDLLRQSTREIDALSVKGKAESIHVCEVLWQESDDLTMKSASIAPAPITSKLLVRHDGREKVLNATHDVFLLGRDVSCDFIIGDRRASRTHARIERRRDKFVLIDQSTNGTYVTLDGEAEFTLKREEALLRNKGKICFGHPFAAGDEVVEFQAN